MADEINFISTSSSEIHNKILKQLMDNINEPLYPGDERRIFAEALAFVFIALYNDLNDVAKQRTLQYARGAVLDALGERVGASRLKPSQAHDIFRFSLDAVQSQNIVIPKGTRITLDSKIYFYTNEVAILQSGELFVDAVGLAEIGGTDYNGFAKGTIKTLVDLIPYISGVINLDGTSGGDNGEPYTVEGDERYRQRIKLAPASFSVAGPQAAYRYYALSADPDIIDVDINSPIANEIVITPLMKGGQIPDKEILDKVINVFADDIRPMCDTVTVVAPTEISYDIDIKYYCTLEDEADAIKIVEGKGGAIENYNLWQSETLGRDINPDQFKKFILAPKGTKEAVTRVDIMSPTFTKLSRTQVAKFSGIINISHEIAGGGT